MDRYSKQVQTLVNVTENTSYMATSLQPFTHVAVLGDIVAYM